MTHGVNFVVTVTPNDKNLIAQKMKFSIKDLFRKCDQIGSKLWIWLHLMNKSLLRNFIFWLVEKYNYTF